MPRIPNPPFMFPASPLKKDSSPPPVPPKDPTCRASASSSVFRAHKRSNSSLPAPAWTHERGSITLDSPSIFSPDLPILSSDIPLPLRLSSRRSLHMTPEPSTVSSKEDSQRLCLLDIRRQIRPSMSTNLSHRSSIRSDLEDQIDLCRNSGSYRDPMDFCDELLGHPSLQMDDETVPLVSATPSETTLPSLAKDTPVLRHTRRSSMLNNFHRKKPSIVIEPDLDPIAESVPVSSRTADTRRYGAFFDLPEADNVALKQRDDALDRLEGRTREDCDLSAAPRSLSQLKGHFARQNLTLDTRALPQNSQISPPTPLDSGYHSAGPSAFFKDSITTLVNSSGVPSAVPSSMGPRHVRSISVSSIRSTCSEWFTRHCRDTGVQMAEKAGAACQNKRQANRNISSDYSAVAVDGHERVQRQSENGKEQKNHAQVAEPEESQSAIRRLLSRLKTKRLQKSRSMTNLLQSEESY